MPVCIMHGPLIKALYIEREKWHPIPVHFIKMFPIPPGARSPRERNGAICFCWGSTVEPEIIFEWSGGKSSKKRELVEWNRGRLPLHGNGYSVHSLFAARAINKLLIIQF